MIGKSLAHYKIEEKLGSGGMGDVYRAHDSKLGRDVALKVMPAETAGDPERRKRFEREARAIASLKHPNIVTIYSVEEVDGVHFLTMELVEGKTLSGLIPAEGMPLEQFLEYSVSLADGMSSAHEQGITHRDLKPANVMLDKDGRVKVLDFGLAKLLHPDANPDADKTQMDSDTAEGTVMGTVAYMSPEQAQGESLDHRSDIFSLGVLFYEMITGARPFQGDNKISTISSILRDEPTPVHEIKQAFPRHLARIVKRCMAKEPTRRYQSALDLRNDLEELKSEVESGEILATGEMSAFRPPSATGGLPRWLIPAVLGVGFVTVVVASFVFMNMLKEKNSQTATAPAMSLQMTPITSDGNSNEATISADGKYVAYLTHDERDRPALGLTQVSTGSAVEIVPAEDDVFLWDPTFSPDGEYIYYVRSPSGPERPSLWRIPVLGGSPQKIRDHVSGRPSFSPDGSEYVFLRARPGLSQVVIAGAGGEERLVLERGDPGWLDDPVWSPDGTTIMAGGQDAATGISGQVTAVPASGGDERVIGSDPTWTDVNEMSWLPDGSGVVVEIEQNYLSNHVWQVSYPDGESHRITTDLNTYHGVEITADGSTLVTQQMLMVNNLWVVRDGTPQQLTSVGRGSASDNARVLPDGRLVYNADQGGSWHIWIRDADGKNPRRLTSESNNAVPVPSPDGKEIAFISDRAGGLDIWKMPVAGSAPTRLTHTSYAVGPEWVGDEIIYRSRGAEPGTIAFYRVPAAGGEPQLIAERNAWGHRGSPDGTRLLYHAYNPEKDHNQIEIMVLATGEVEHVMYLREWEEATWSPDGTAIHYSNHVDGQDNVYSHPITAGDDTSGDVMITNFDDGVDILSIAWSKDGKTLALSRGTTSRDVVLLKGFR